MIANVHATSAETVVMKLSFQEFEGLIQIATAVSIIKEINNNLVLKSTMKIVFNQSPFFSTVYYICISETLNLAACENSGPLRFPFFVCVFLFFICVFFFFFYYLRFLFCLPLSLLYSLGQLERSLNAISDKNKAKKFICFVSFRNQN